MNPEQEKALDIFVEIARALLAEVDGGGDLGYHLDTAEYAGRLCGVLRLLGEPYPEPYGVKQRIYEVADYGAVV